MRILTVFGVIVAGLAIGAAAVLAPLSISSSRTAGSPTGWMAGVSGQVADVVRTTVATLTVASQPASPDGASQAPRPTAARSLTGSKTDSNDGVVPAVAIGIDASSATAGDSPKAVASVAHPASATDGVTKRVAVALENGGARKQTSSKPAGEEARIDLIRDIQRELKRVGCYDGEADGSWGTVSKRAIATFTERVNASLAIEEPDFILLTLLQGHSGQACSANCPAGQSAAPSLAGSSAGVRCVPNGVLAQTGKTVKDRDRATQPRDQLLAQRPTALQPSSQPSGTAPLLNPATGETTSSAPIVNQMAAVSAGAAVGGTVGVGAVGSAWSAKVITEPAAPAKTGVSAKPSIANNSTGGIANAVAAPAALTSVVPLPGRMAIGAPVPASPSADIVGAAPALTPPQSGFLVACSS